MSRVFRFASVAGASLALLSFVGVSSAKDVTPGSQPLAAALQAVNSSPSPGAIASVAQTAAQNYIATVIADAINAAKANKPDLSAAELEKIANDALHSDATAAGLTAIATTATSNLIAASGQSSDGAAAAATAERIAAAVNAGAAAAVNNAIASLGIAAGSLAAPQVTITTSQKGNEVKVVATAGAGTATVTSTQTVAGTTVSALRTFTSQGGALSGPNPIVPPIPATQIVSPSRS